MSRPPRSLREMTQPRFALRRDEAAVSLGISPTLFSEWVLQGRMPRGSKIDGVMLWDAQELFEAWIRLRDAARAPAEEANPFDEMIA